MCDHTKSPKLFCISQSCTETECFVCFQCAKRLHSHSGKELLIQQKEVALLINRFELPSLIKQQHKSCNIKIYKFLNRIKTEFANKMEEMISGIMSKIKYPYLFQSQLLESYRLIRDRNYQRLQPGKLRQFYKISKTLCESQYLQKQQKYYNQFLGQSQQLLYNLSQKIAVIEETFQFKIHGDVILMQKECIGQINSYKSKHQVERSLSKRDYQKNIQFDRMDLSSNCKENAVKLQFVTPVKSKNQLDVSLENISLKSPSIDLQKARKNSDNYLLIGQKQILPRSIQIIEEISSKNVQQSQKSKIVNFNEVKTSKSFNESNTHSIKKNQSDNKQLILNKDGKDLSITTQIGMNSYTYTDQSQNSININISGIKRENKQIDSLVQLSNKVSQIQSEAAKGQQQKLKKQQLDQNIIAIIKQRQQNVLKKFNQLKKQLESKEDKRVMEESIKSTQESQTFNSCKLNTKSQIINKQKQMRKSQVKVAQKQQPFIKANNNNSSISKKQSKQTKSPKKQFQQPLSKIQAHNKNNLTVVVNQQRRINRNIDNVSIGKYVIAKEKGQKSKWDLSINNNISNTKQIPLLDQNQQISPRKLKGHKRNKSATASPQKELEVACNYYVNLLKINELKDNEKAKDFLQKYNEKHQNNITAAQQLTYTYLQTGRAKQCLTICNKYLQKLQTLAINQNHKLNLIINKAAALNMLGRQNQAITYLFQKLKIIQHQKMHKNIGDAYYNMSLTNKAVYHYEKAITLNDKYDEAFYNLAVILYTQESYFNAKMNIDKAIALQPDNDQYQELLLAVKERILMNSQV